VTTAGEAVAQATRRLRETGSPSPRLDAQLLLRQVTGWSRTDLLAHPEWALSPVDESAFNRLIARRARAEPIAYLVGEREFYGRMFRVDRRALIPRPETELLVELGIAAFERWRLRTGASLPTLVDVGTGCGAVAISVAAEVDAPVIATDISFEALTLAAENTARLAPGRVRLAQADLLQALTGPLHIVLANLPYVPAGRVLPADVADYEPAIAIFGGRRGTELIERLLGQAGELLAPGGEIAVELDEEAQAQPVAALARALFPTADVRIRRDGGGYDRVVRVLTERP
jgi:release factor glutamine methyltransferase